MAKTTLDTLAATVADLEDDEAAAAATRAKRDELIRKLARQKTGPQVKEIAQTGKVTPRRVHQLAH